MDDETLLDAVADMEIGGHLNSLFAVPVIGVSGPEDFSRGIVAPFV